jgi:hypothetical protein
VLTARDLCTTGAAAGPEAVDVDGTTTLRDLLPILAHAGQLRVVMSGTPVGTLDRAVALEALRGEQPQGGRRA